MKPTKKTRKPVDKLTPADFKVFPVWEYASGEEGVEGMDETWVRPVCSKQIPAHEYSQLVASTFTTSNGSHYSGFMVVTPACSTKKTLDHTGGTLFEKGRQCFLIDLNGPAIDFMKKESIKDLKDALKLSEQKIFPLSFVLDVLIEGETTLRQGVFKAQRSTKAK